MRRLTNFIQLQGKFVRKKISKFQTELGRIFKKFKTLELADNHIVCLSIYVQSDQVDATPHITNKLEPRVAYARILKRGLEITSYFISN